MIFEPSKKLQRMLAWSDKLHAEFTDSWCQLFKTDNYLKKKAVHDRLICRIRRQILTESGMTVEFSARTHRLHKFSAYRAHHRIGYRYLIECVAE